jgi:dihydroneopterin aldolase/2-amino-4-hydroxy-6-hydroxymethyldihydropteridine diphosphokinase/dihydropteroate synthase
MADIIFLRNVRITATVGLDCWHRDKPQPVLISTSLYADVRVAGDSDNVLDTIHYGNVYKALAGALSNSKYKTLQSCTEEVCQICLRVGGGDKVCATVILPKGLLRTEGEDGGIGMRLNMAKNSDGSMAIQSQTLLVKNLRLYCVLGVNPHERKDKQLVVINLELTLDLMADETDHQTKLEPLIQVSCSKPDHL